MVSGTVRDPGQGGHRFVWNAEPVDDAGSRLFHDAAEATTP